MIYTSERARTAILVLSAVSLCLILFAAPDHGKPAPGLPDRADPPARPAPLTADDPMLSELWARVDSLDAEGLPHSAARLVEEILLLARAQNDGPAVLRATFYRAKYASFLAEDVINTVIVDLRDELEQAVPPVSSMLHSVLGEVFWRYYLGNRFRFLNRTAVVDHDDGDVQTWDLTRILGEAARHYRLSLKPASLLQASHAAEFSEVIHPGTGTWHLRPTLYDFLAHRAIDFFDGAEGEAALPGARTPLDENALFAPAGEFIAWHVPDLDSEDLRLAAFAVVQSLMAFHTAEANTAALIDADLFRLQLARRHAKGGDAKLRYEQALRNMMERYRDEPAASSAYFELAAFLDELGRAYDPEANPAVKLDRREAFDLCETARRRFRSTWGTAACLNLQAQIGAPEVGFTAERAVLPEEAFPVLVRYRNVRTAVLTFRKIDYEDWLEYHASPHRIRTAMVDSFLTGRPAHQREYALPWEGDFQEREIEIEAPPMEAGLYFVTAHLAEDTVRTYHHFGFVEATGVAFVSRPEGRRNRHDIYVIDRKTGEPLPGATVTSWSLGWDSGKRATDIRRQGQDLTNGAGFARTQSLRYRGEVVEIRHGDRSHLAHARMAGVWGERAYRSEPVTFFFTDRAIYRPGQTVHFKGMRVRRQNEDDFRTQAGRRAKVKLRDANHREVAELSLRSNEFGTFSGSFQIPADVLTGRFSISDDYGRTSIRVEEYRRPRFEVVFDTLDGTPALDEAATVTGRAAGYAGMAISGAEVSYRVVRQARFPAWFRWFAPDAPDAQIDHGSVTSGPDGRFEITFVAEADGSVDPASDPTFIFRIEADVTDATGETQSGQTRVPLGYTAIRLDLDVPDVLDVERDRSLRISAQNRAGGDLSTEGTLLIERLQPPDQPVIPGRPAAGEGLFFRPGAMNVQRQLADEMRRWPVAERVLERAFRTTNGAQIQLPEIRSWQEGAYRITAVSTDDQGRESRAERVVTVVSSASEAMPYPSLSFFAPLKSQGEPGESAAFLVGASRPTTVLVEVEWRGRIVSREQFQPAGGKRLIEVPIRERYRGNFGVHVVMVAENRAFAHTQVVTVPYTNKRLNVRLATFRDRLLPGEQEEWRITVSGPDSEPVAAEMLATMYDASLDAFMPHRMRLDLYHSRHLRLFWNTRDAFAAADLTAHTARPPPPDPPRKFYPRLNWFGFDYFGHRPRRWTVTRSRPGEIGGAPSGRLVSGFVRDRDTGEGLPGANIIIDGTDFGAITDRTGSFRLRLPGGRRTLRVSYIGYDTETVNVGNRTNVQVYLAPASIVAEEVVVAGILRNQAAMIEADADAHFYAELAHDADPPPPPVPAVPERLRLVQARADLRETAFFFPHLRTNEAGEIIFSFTMPEALTRWRFLGLAHTSDMQYGHIEQEIVTEKDLMVTPHAPRFVREGDTLHFAAKVDNLSGERISGEAALMLFDAVTLEPVDSRLGNGEAVRSFAVGDGGSADFRWRLVVPPGLEALSYRVVASAGDFSDGEENLLPVLTNRMLVTETLPLPVRGSGTSSFMLEKLRLNDSESLSHHRLTLEFTPNPAWYAVASLPYLAEFPYECSEQIFSRFYANSIAAHIVRTDPRIERTYRQWRDDDAEILRSRLELNEELKSLALEETPWLLQARNETQRRQRIARLFDERRITRELASNLRRLQRMQRPDGSFPWFEGGDGNRFITQHIVAGLAHLDHLGVMTPLRDDRTRLMIRNAVTYLDERMLESYQSDRKRDDSNQHVLRPIGVHYLYTRTMYPEIEMTAPQREAYDFYLGFARRHWLSHTVYLQGMIALALHRTGDQETPAAVVRSLRERAHHSDELGMYWPVEGGFLWHQGQVETQALLIELFHHVARDWEAVDAMQTWLLKQRQVQDWRTTKATTAAVYALLMRGKDLLGHDSEVRLTVGAELMDLSEPEHSAEAGSGYFRRSWEPDEIRTEMASVTVDRQGDGPAWGALYWQYFEDLDRITPHETPLKLEKELHIRRLTDGGPVLERLDDGSVVHPGDLLTVRIVLRVDREMEFVHMKDMRASGLEPVNVLSGYRRQGTLRYYESTRDASTNFFFSRLPRGTHVFEYPLRVAHAGDFSNGIATIQSMYAPEFASHSAGIRLRVQERERPAEVARVEE